MIVSEDLINGILREIDVMYSEGLLKIDDADDLSKSVGWINGKSLNESNVSYVIECLRGYKKFMNAEAVTRIINLCRKTFGSYM
ncbi:MAG TPA: hypothetical protein PK079_00660 [Leptospiraceae bacterium]|nr:hypothetical protein [Leptospiraceae bacterium]HMW03978.1 hypothetical protein [Leptospiraceae bacterium]HMX35324.1 hypothetical protein [Leptospiraceae bacterium]HMY29958.1 hypothetical protein [Leptospiraceae bacterium]HMZ66765.1 hypothetical protein [Leptospiraceae bacterium]